MVLFCVSFPISLPSRLQACSACCVSKYGVIMFRFLPSEVILDILVDFMRIDMLGLALLDRAVTNHNSRPDWFFVLTAMPHPQGSAERSRRHHRYCLRRLGIYLRWLASRKVTVGCLLVCPEDIDVAVEECRGILAAGDVAGVYSLVFEEQYSGRYNTGQSLAAFVSLFPDLEAIDCEKWHQLGNFHLDQLRTHRPLTSLKLSKDCWWDFSPDAIVGVIKHSCSENLREFSCAAFNEVVRALCERCHSLESIALSVESMDTLDLMQTLCSHNSRTLRYLRLGLCLESKEDPVIMHELLLNILQPCSRLERVELDYRTPIVLFPAKLINHFADAFSLLSDVVINGSQFLFNRKSTKVVSCDIFWKESAESPIRTACEGFVIPIRAFHLGKHATGEDYVFMDWGEKIGSELEELSIAGDHRSEYDEFVGFAEQFLLFVADRCNNLCKVDLSGILVCDAGIAELSERCPHINSITLNDIEHVADIGMIQFLSHCKCLESISLSNFPRVTDKTVKVLANRFPSLTNLELRDTAITKLCLFKLIWRRKLTVNVLSCPEVDWIKRKLLQERFSPMPKCVVVVGSERVGRDNQRRHESDEGNDDTGSESEEDDDFED